MARPAAVTAPAMTRVLMNVRMYVGWLKNLA